MAQYAKSNMAHRFIYQWAIFDIGALPSQHFSQIFHSAIHEAAVCSMIPAM
jgi:hypothetical protein